jgi:hypothetical protein
VNGDTPLLKQSVAAILAPLLEDLDVELDEHERMLIEVALAQAAMRGYRLATVAN